MTRVMHRAEPSSAVSSSRLSSFLGTFGLHDWADVAAGNGGWRLDQDEGGPEEVFVLDAGEFKKLVGEVLDGYEALTAIGVIPATGRRVWVGIEWEGDERDNGTWIYHYTGTDDYTEFERELEREEAEEEKERIQDAEVRWP